MRKQTEKTVITTVGTSLLRRCNIHVDQKLLKRPVENYEQVKKSLHHLEKELQELTQNDESCAELATLKHFKSSHYEHIFIATDTIASYICAKAISSRFSNSAVKVAEHLNLDRVENYQRGIDSLIAIFYDIAQQGYKEFIINITGGFKGVIPYLSTLAQIFDAQLIYDFEGEENELITISPLPIEFDPFITEYYYPYLQNPASAKGKNFYKLQELGLITPHKTLTSLGKIVTLAIEKNFFPKTTLGHFMELKLYEHFTQHYFAGRRKYFGFKIEKIIHALKLQENSKHLTDVDIALLGKEDFVWVEVKSANKLVNGLNQLFEQIKNRQVPFAKKVGKKLRKYVLVFYTFHDRVKRRKFQNITTYLQHRGIEFEAYYFKVPLSMDNPKNSTVFQYALDSFTVKGLQRL